MNGTARVRIAFLVLIAMFLGLGVLWLRLDRSPPSWDDAYYLANSLVLFDALTDGGVPEYARTFMTVMGSKPPLIAALPTPVYLLFGRRPRAAYLVNIAALFITLSALYGLGKHYSSPRAGLFALYIAGTMPMIYGLSHWFLVECGLIAIVCVAMCLLAKWNETQKAGKGILLGATCGAGLLMKMSFGIVVAIPILYFARRISWRARIAGSATITLIAAPWYLVHWKAAMGTALRAGSSSTAAVYETGAIFSVSELWKYFVNVANTAPAIYVLLLLILAVVFFRSVKPQAWRGLAFSALWAAPVLFLAFSHYRELRYAAPFLPALALALGILFDAALAPDTPAGRHPFLTGVVTTILLVLPLLSMLQSSFQILDERPFEMGGLLFVPPRFDYAHALRREEWPQAQILDNIYRRTKRWGGERISVLIGTDTVRFNGDNFRLAAVRNKLPFDISTTAYQPDEQKLELMLDSSAFFVYKEGGEPDATHFNPQQSALLRHLRDTGRFDDFLPARNLPDGGSAHVFANRYPGRFELTGVFLPGGLDPTPSPIAIFSNGIVLDSLSVAITTGGLDVKYRWRCQRPVQRDYRCFTHVIDAEGNIVSNLDHFILSSDPAMSRWKEGDVAVERLFFPASAMRREEMYRLRVGLFDLATGERASINSSLPLADNGTGVLFNLIDTASRKELAH